MPELPEVETIRSQLDKALKNREIKKIEVLREKSFIGNERELEGQKIIKVGRKAKVLEIYFQKSTKMVVIHLKMTGQLVFVDKEHRIMGGHPSPDWVGKLPAKHTRVIWNFRDGSKLFFNDMRVFGWMKIMLKDEYITAVRKLSPDIVDPEFTDNYLFKILNKSNKAVKLVLLDQDKMGGLGNIYVNDALFLAGIRPDRKANSLSLKEVVKLHKAIVRVINLGIKYGGASASNYVQVSGLGGKYQEHFLVYKKDGQKCKVCGEVIKKIKLGGRGTYFCPKCQQ